MKISNNKKICLESHFSELSGNAFIKIAVFGAMSSGKSTFLNALIGFDLLPSKNEACTAKIISIEDSDNNNHFTAYYFNNEGIKSVDYKIKDDLIKQWNNKDEIFSIHINGNLPGINNYLKSKIIFIDTPGPNYYNNKLHQDIFKMVIENKIYDLICIVLDITILNSNDEKNLLNIIFNSNKQIFASDKTIFILNKIDNIDLEKDDLNSIIENTKEYLINSFKIKNPIILPLSSFAAKLFKKTLGDNKLSPKESIHLDSYLSLFNSNYYKLNAQIKCNGYHIDIKKKSLNIKRKGRKFRYYNPLTWLYYRSNDFLLKFGGKDYCSLDIHNGLKNSGILHIEELFNIKLRLNGKFSKTAKRNHN